MRGPKYLVIQLDGVRRTPENTTGKAVHMNTSGWTAECSWIYQLVGPREKRQNVSMSPAALRALVVALCVCVGQPVQAQGFLKKIQAKTRAVVETVQQTGEMADTALSKAGQTAAAVKCLASDSTCVGQANAQGQPQVAADSSGKQLPSPAGSDTLPPRADVGLQARPDTSGS